MIKLSILVPFASNPIFLKTKNCGKSTILIIDVPRTMYVIKTILKVINMFFIKHIFIFLKFKLSNPTKAYVGRNAEVKKPNKALIISILFISINGFKLSNSACGIRKNIEIIGKTGLKKIKRER